MNKITAALEEAVEIAKGEKPAARITVNGHQYVPEAEVEHLRAEIGKLHKVWFSGADLDKDAISQQCLALFLAVHQQTEDSSK